jgi:Uma2 family endonuclease
MMTMEIAEKTYTVEEFLELDLPDDQKYELVRGRIVPRGATSGRHAEIVCTIGTLLKNYAMQNQNGRVFTEGSTTLGIAGGDEYRTPDVCFVAAGRLPANFDGPIPVAPDLAVEVISPTDQHQVVQEKVDLYKQTGVKTVWLVYMSHSYVVVYRENGAKRTWLDEPDELTDTAILPGFKVLIKDLFI